MSEVADEYVKKAIHIYNSMHKLQGLAKDKANSFDDFSIFCKYVTEQAKLNNQFKHIADDICQIADGERFAVGKISSKFDQLKEVRILILWIRTEIRSLRRFLTNGQVAEFEKLIEDCENNQTFDTIGSYETRLKNVSGRLQEFTKQVEEINDFVNQIKAKIKQAKHLFANVQVVEFEKLIEDCDNNLTFDTIGNYKIKLKNANKQLCELIVQLKETQEFAALTLRVKAFVKSKNFEKAIACYDEVLKTEPNNSKYLTGKAEVLCELGKYELDNFEKEQAPKSVSEAMARLSSLMTTSRKPRPQPPKGKFKDAIICYDKVLDLDSNNFDALKGKADILRTHLENPREAIIRVYIE